MIPNAQRMFNFDLGETADAIRETVQQFSANEIAPRAADAAKSRKLTLALALTTGCNSRNNTLPERHPGEANDEGAA